MRILQVLDRSNHTNKPVGDLPENPHPSAPRPVCAHLYLVAVTNQGHELSRSWQPFDKRHNDWDKRQLQFDDLLALLGLIRGENDLQAGDHAVLVRSHVQVVSNAVDESLLFT